MHRSHAQASSLGQIYTGETGETHVKPSSAAARGPHFTDPPSHGYVQWMLTRTALLQLGSDDMVLPLYIYMQLQMAASLTVTAWPHMNLGSRHGPPESQ